jgi:hypothetical protein
MLSRRLNGDDQASETANRDRQHHCGEPETLLAGITDPANPGLRRRMTAPGASATSHPT